MGVRDVSPVTQSQAVVAEQITAAERLIQTMRRIRNQELQFADEPGFAVAVKALERPEAAHPGSVPQYSIEEVRERAEARILASKDTSVLHVSRGGDDVAAALLG